MSASVAKRGGWRNSGPGGQDLRKGEREEAELGEAGWSEAGGRGEAKGLGPGQTGRQACWPRVVHAGVRGACEAARTWFAGHREPAVSGVKHTVAPDSI
jgi:hypothetical protein